MNSAEDHVVISRDEFDVFIPRDHEHGKQQNNI